MKENNVIDLAGRETGRDALTELLRNGARTLIAQALEAELGELLEQFKDRQDEQGRALVVRNGYQPEREIQTGIGPVTVKVPKVRGRGGKPTFRSALVPPYVRKTGTLEAALPWLYLKGISTGEMQTALEALVGPEAKGLSSSTAQVLGGRGVRRLSEEPREVLHRADIGGLGPGAKLAQRHVVDHALTQGADGLRDLSHRRAPVSERGGLPHSST